MCVAGAPAFGQVPVFGQTTQPAQASQPYPVLGTATGARPSGSAIFPVAASIQGAPAASQPAAAQTVPTQPPGTPELLPPSDNPPSAVDQSIFSPPSWLNFSVDFKDGVFFKTNDGLFSLRINNLLQADYRDFAHTAQDKHVPAGLDDNFTIPRYWLILRGNATEYVDYQLIIATGVASNDTGGPATVNLLDAFLDFNPFGQEAKELFQLRVGRFKTPFLYQFYKLSPQDTVTPELSMFSTNFLQNRQDGAMVHGLLFDKRLDYAAGIFNGVPNSYEVSQSNREGIFYLGFAPFLLNEGSVFQNLNLIGSAAVGDQFGIASVPAALGTAIPSAGPPNNLHLSPTFLVFAPPAGLKNGAAVTVQHGARAVWDFEVVYSWRSFNLFAEYDAGYSTYALADAKNGVIKGTTNEVSLSGYSVAATYFLTGEQITPARRRVQPLRPYSWTNGGCGAFEAYGRFSNLVLGSNVFTDNFASSKLFANEVNATDVGVNWYLNEYIKVIFDWQHAMFNQPITLTGASGGNTTKTEDLFWARFQLYY